MTLTAPAVPHPTPQWDAGALTRRVWLERPIEVGLPKTGGLPVSVSPPESRQHFDVWTFLDAGGSDRSTWTANGLLTDPLARRRTRRDGQRADTGKAQVRPPLALPGMMSYNRRDGCSSPLGHPERSGLTWSFVFFTRPPPRSGSASATGAFRHPGRRHPVGVAAVAGLRRPADLLVLRRDDAAVHGRRGRPGVRHAHRALPRTDAPA